MSLARSLVTLLLADGNVGSVHAKYSTRVNSGHMSVFSPNYFAKISTNLEIERSCDGGFFLGGGLGVQLS